jgi:hypothetical protein
MTSGKINMQASDTHRRERMQDESGQRKNPAIRNAILQFHLNSSTVANGSADQGRKRLIVNFVGFTEDPKVGIFFL